MKKIIASVLSIMMLISLFACGARSNISEKSVVTTCFPIYDIANSLLENDANVILLLKPGQDSHSYDPSAKDIVKIKNCDVFLCIGGKDEKWVKTLLSGKDMKDVNALSLINAVPPIAFEEGHDSNDGHDHSHEYDEHIWTSPKNMLIMLQTIKTSLISAYPELETAINERAEAYSEKLKSIDTQLTTVVANAERKTVIFGDRFPFLHLFTDYGIEYSAAYPGCSEMTEPSAATVAELINKIKAENIPAVFKTQLSNGRIAEAIAEQTDAEIFVLHSLATLTKDEWERNETYYSIMTKNIEALQSALD